MSTSSSRPSPQRVREVAVIAFHPLFLAFCADLLASSRVDVSRTLLEPSSTRLPSLPPADLYIVDGQSQRWTEEVIAPLMGRPRRPPVLVCAASFPAETASALLRLGVRGLLPHSQHADLPRAVEHLVAGKYWVPRDLLAAFVEKIVANVPRPQLSAGRLSRREHEILDCLMQNLSNKEIGARLNISERTVKFHVSNLLAKHGVERRADLILLGYQHKQ